MSPETLAADPLYTVPEVAQYLRCSVRTVFDLVRRGDLPAVKIGRLTRITAGQLAAYLNQSVLG